MEEAKNGFVCAELNSQGSVEGMILQEPIHVLDSPSTEGGSGNDRVFLILNLLQLIIFHTCYIHILSRPSSPPSVRMPPPSAHPTPLSPHRAPAPGTRCALPHLSSTYQGFPVHATPILLPPEQLL